MIDWVTNREVLVGEDTLLQLPELLEKQGCRKVFLVARKKADCLQKVCNMFDEKNIPFVLYDKVKGEPNLAVIDKGTDICTAQGCDSVVAIGGGSVIDTSKMIAMMATNGGKAEDYQIDGKAVEKKPLFFVAVPTTAGSGSEATRVSVIFNENKGYKKAAYDNSMIAQVTILDPVTTLGLPAKVTAATGMDAITHAIETYTSLNANEFSRMYSLHGLKLLVKNIVTAYNEPDNIKAREGMLLGSYFAGCSLAVGTCLAHIVGQPLGAIYNIPHGDACSIFLIPSMRMNKDYCLSQYADIAEALGADRKGKGDEEMFEQAVAILQDITAKVNAPTALTQYLDRDKIDVELAVENVATSMAHIKHNPRPVSPELFRELILAAM